MPTAASTSASAAKIAEQHHAETLPRHRAGYDVFHRVDVRNRLVLVDRPDGIPQRGRETHRIDVGPHNQRIRRKKLKLPVAQIHLHFRLGEKVVLP